MYSDKSISFIIPIYNCASYIEDCLHSIISQNIPQKEIILINDGSTDTTQAICTSYATKYDFIHLIEQKNAGTSSARNRGLEIATGDYVWFVDSDDMIADGIIPMIMPYLSENVEIICFNHIERTAYSDINKMTFHSVEKCSAISFLEKGLPGYLWNKIFRKDIVENIRFLEGTKNIEDFLFCIEAISDANFIVCLPEVGYIYNCTNQTSTSRNKNWENLMKLSSDSFKIHLKLNQIIQNHTGKLKEILSSMLYISIAGHLRSLLIDYNRTFLLDAIKFYKVNSLYPLKLTKNKKANFFIRITNIRYVISAIAYVYDLKRKYCVKNI